MDKPQNIFIKSILQHNENFPDYSIYVHTYIYSAHMHVHTHTYANTYTRTYICTLTRTHIHMDTHKLAHVSLHAYTRALTDARTHTHTSLICIYCSYYYICIESVVDSIASREDTVMFCNDRASRSLQRCHQHSVRDTL